MLKTIIKGFIKVQIVLFMLYLLQLNYGLYYQPDFHSGDLQFNQSVYEQLQFLKEEIHDGAAEDMQKYYPEGFIFLYAIYALTWGNFIADLPNQSELHKEGLQEITHSWEKINSGTGRKIFNRDLPLSYGIFYNGWNNYVLGTLLKNTPPEQRTSQLIQLYENRCAEIALAFEASEYPYLDSYIWNAWPADNFVAMASLAIHDEIFPQKFGALKRDWMAKVKNHLDSKTGLIPHAVSSGVQKMREGARGCSQSLTLNFLYEIDEAFGREQYQKFKKLFFEKRLGLLGIREYPIGTSGSGDVDSGPVIWDIGGAASIVGQRTIWKYGDYAASKDLRNSIDAFGSAISFNSKKRYLLGVLPMADAFIAWSNVAETKPTEHQPENSKLYVHLISSVLLIGFGFLFKRLRN